MTRPGQRLHSFIEGLVIGPDGHFYVADVPYGRIFRIQSDLSCWSEVFHYDGEPHGLAFAADGELLVADYRKGILRINLTTRAISVVCDHCDGVRFKGLSDLVLDQDSNIWFTDPGRTSLSDPSGGLLRRTREGEVTCIIDNIPYPNGVAISKDGAHVYVAATRANAVWRLLRVSPESRPMAGIFLQLSGGLGPDGLAVNGRGEIAVAHAQAGSVWLFDRVGELMLKIRTPGGLWTTSVRFGGEGERRLFIADAETGSIFGFDL
jgi:gluconolactonase